MKRLDLFKLTVKAVEAAKNVARLTGVAEHQVYVGGSLSLILQDVMDRDIHDIDIIVNVDNPAKASMVINTLKAHCALMQREGSISEVCYSYFVGDILYNGNKYAINVIVDTARYSWFVSTMIQGIKLQHPTIVKMAKLMYNRPKDVKDIQAIIDWEIKNNI